MNTLLTAGRAFFNENMLDDSASGVPTRSQVLRQERHTASSAGLLWAPYSPYGRRHHTVHTVSHTATLKTVFSNSAAQAQSSSIMIHLFSKLAK